MRNCLVLMLLLLGLPCLAESMPGEEAYLAGDLAQRAGRASEALGLFESVRVAGGPLAGFAQVRAWEAAWQSGNAAAEQAAWNWLQQAPASPERDLCAARLGVRFAQTGRGAEASAMLMPLVQLDPVPWWMDAVLWEAGDALVRSAAASETGYACFLRIVERPGYAPQRNDAARRLRDSPNVDHRRSAAIALFRAGGLDEASAIMDNAPLGLRDAQGQPMATAAFLAALSTAGAQLADSTAVLALLEANRDQAWLPLVVSRAVRTTRAQNPAGARALALWLFGAFPASREAGDSVWFVAQGLAAAGDMEALALYELLSAKAEGYWRNTNAAHEIAHYWLKKGDLAAAQKAAELLGARYPESRFRAELYYDLGQRWRAAGNPKQAQRNFAFAINSGPGDYFAHRALQVLHEGLSDAGLVLPASVNLQLDGASAVLQPIPGLLAAVPPLPEAVEGDPRTARARFFGRHGLAEAEWEALGVLRGLKGEEADGPWYLALADAGLGFTAQQWADKRGWGMNGPTRTLARWRLEFPRPYLDIYEQHGKALGVDPYFLMAISRQESTFRASIFSRSGAAGVMQLMPATARWMKTNTPGATDAVVGNLTSPVNSILLGANYIAQMLDKFGGNMLYAAAAYNAGPGNMNKWLKQMPDPTPDGFVDFIPFDETSGYVRKVLGNYAAYRSLYPAQ